MAQHGEWDVCDVHEHVDGCFAESLPRGYGNLVDFPLDLAGEINDGRPPHSAGLTWWLEIGLGFSRTPEPFRPLSYAVLTEDHFGTPARLHVAPRAPMRPSSPRAPPWSPPPVARPPWGAVPQRAAPRAARAPTRRLRGALARSGLPALRAPREGSARGERARRAREASPRSVGVAARLLRQHTLAPGPMPPTPPPSAAQGWWTGTS